MRVVGYWVLYATVGVLLLAMMIGGGGELGAEDKSSPTRSGTKVLGAFSGTALAIAGLGAYLLSDPTVLPTWPTLMLAIMAPIGLGLSTWSCVRISDDLKAYDKKQGAKIFRP